MKTLLRLGAICAIALLYTNTARAQIGTATFVMGQQNELSIFLAGVNTLENTTYTAYNAASPIAGDILWDFGGGACPNQYASYQAAGTAYYVYVTSGNVPFVSSTPPSQLGVGSGHVYQGSTNLCTNDSVTGQFVGSFVTDSNDYVIPFIRAGYDVFLEPTTDGYGADESAGLTYDINPFPAATTSVPQVLDIGFAGTHAYNAPIPKTAASAIVDVAFSAISTNAIVGIFFLRQGSSTINSGCTSVPMHDYLWDPTPTSGHTAQQLRVPVDQQSHIWLGSCSVPTGGINIAVTYVGYVESVTQPVISNYYP